MKGSTGGKKGGKGRKKDAREGKGGTGCNVMAGQRRLSDSYPAFFLPIATTSNKKFLKVQKL